MSNVHITIIMKDVNAEGFSAKELEELYTIVLKRALSDVPTEVTVEVEE